MRRETIMSEVNFSVMLRCFFCLAGIDLENIVYYRDNTHYFVMTAKKQSLLDKGVVIHVRNMGVR